MDDNVTANDRVNARAKRRSPTRSPDPPLEWSPREPPDHQTASGLGVLQIGADTLWRAPGRNRKGSDEAH
jgi:hypothetical protein